MGKEWWDIKVPTKLVANPQDYVKYDATPKDKTVQVNRIYIQADKSACYASHMANLSSYTYYCKPLAGKSLLAEDMFLRWIELGKINNLVPGNVVPEREGAGNYLRIPHSNNRHQIYASLCFHRWAENQPGMVYTCVTLCELNPAINFFQAFHYSLMKYNILSGHSFCNMVKLYDYSRQEGMNVPAYIYLPSGLAVRLFFKSTPKRPMGYAGVYADRATISYRYTSFHIDEVMQQKMGCIPPTAAFSPKYDRNGRLLKSPGVRPDLCVSELHHILWDEWSGLYEMDDPTSKQISALYREVMERKGLADLRN